MKDLWKNLDKITIFLKKSPIKILMLDFDGTLSRIVKSPQEAVLSTETKNLLKNLSRKKGFYIVIISGRNLKDLKAKINIKNIIYAGNHGLEGEIFHKKYSFLIPDKMSEAVRNIRGQLDKIAGQFSGVFIEDKGLILSFHYRLANKKQLPEIKLLLKKILKSYVENKLISIIAGKMVFDIKPKVNWNKGSFAKLAINKINLRIKKMPVTIFIGDDATDLDAFRALKKDITIQVGVDYRSSAKYWLNDTEDVFRFLEWINEKA